MIIFGVILLIAVSGTFTAAEIGLDFVPRSDWGAQEPTEEITDLQSPVKRVIIAHTATSNCMTQSDCADKVRSIQLFHMQHFSDIGINFLVGGDGSVFEGRGWLKQGAHTRGYNTDSICIALIGTFDKLEPSASQLNATKLLIEKGVAQDRLQQDYKLFGHRQFFATNSPGDQLYNIIQGWSHWAKEI